jgi:hypothetical protein
MLAISCLPSAMMLSCEQSAWQIMQIYVLRIYRRDTRRFGGVLEDAQTGRSVTFRTIRELTDLLRTASVKPARKLKAPRSRSS